MLNDYLPATADRVPEHTADEPNRRIRQETEASVAYYANHPQQIPERLAELDAEWDIERVLEANAATIALGGLALGSAVDKRFLALPFAVCGFLLQHALQGWCPPVALFRRQGVRIAAEIAEERYALKYLRGDFRDQAVSGASAMGRAREALAAAARAADD